MATLDLVLSNGTVVDGSGEPGFRADVGVAAGRIVAVGRGLRAERAVDCSAHVVAPGFIDTHSHSDLKALAEPALPMKVRQGITLEVLGQDGISVAPVKSEDRGTWQEKLAGLLGDFGVAWSWSTVAEYLAALAAAAPAPDLAYLVPHGTLRHFVMGPDDRRPAAAELSAMQAALAECLRQGAVGLSTGLIYPPCCYADTDELIALGEVLARAGSPLVAHVRSESDYLLDALDEMVRVAEAARCPVHVSHLKVAGRENWGRAEAVVARFEEARARGLSLTADQYPYAAGSTLLGAVLPPWAHDGGTEATLRRLRDPDARARLRGEMLDPAPSRWDNFWKWSGPEGILVADVPSGRRPELPGRTVAEAAGAAGTDPLEFTLDLLRDERLGVAMVSFSQAEEVVERFLRLPFVNLCTDGLLGGRPHPRAYGAFPRLLGRYVRERGTLTLEEAVRKMTSQAARALGFSGVGLVREGLRANLVVFDPATVADRATFADPRQFPDGVRDVLVGGRFVVREGRPTDERPGRVAGAGPRWS